MTENFMNFTSKFKLEELQISETEHWCWSLRPIQCTLGAGILSLKRPAESMSELTKDEGADLITISKVIETTLDNAFKMDKINYIMLMMIDSHVHYHVIPRYSKDISFAGITFKDLGWPKPPVLDADVLNADVLMNIKEHLTSKLSV